MPGLPTYCQNPKILVFPKQYLPLQQKCINVNWDDGQKLPLQAKYNEPKKNESIIMIDPFQMSKF